MSLDTTLSTPAPAESAPAPAVAPASPAAAPDSGTPVAVPATSDAPASNALADAFAALAAGTTHAMRTPEPEPVAAPEPAAPAAPTGEQPRDPATGQFLPKAEAPTGEPVVEPAADPAAAATEPTAEGAAPVEEPVGEEPVDPALVVELLPRRPHEEPLQIAVDSPETAERLRQTLRGAMRREEYEEAMRSVQVAQQRAEEVELSLLVDPATAIQQTLSPEQTETLLLLLLSDDQVFQRLSPKLSELMDDTGRRVVRADVRERYLDQREQARETLAQRRAVTANLRDVQTAIDAIAPEHLPEAQRAMWVRDAQRDLAQLCRAHNIQLLDPLKVPAALRARLVASGVDPSVAEESVFRALRGGRAPAPSANRSADAPRAAVPSAPPAAPPRSGPPTAGTRPVQSLKAAHERRAAAGATAGPGVGTPAAGGLPSLPQGAGLTEALALVKSMGPRAS